ncbi:PIR Superfamily Protein [Plasmodium ovale wallikeri]|uniref:PIR Superfamily Protein n=1 Tax=Plasmodium ovale wallikeri TaxID=864142 RepID=A0A1A9AIE1_PLAOA|nr:PIR Superfamily Protein [Plasmodium ovale wallikeri]SBT56373.1 PIR Superfamily Protein [Plasmodium ovale wallikeri]
MSHGVADIVCYSFFESFKDYKIYEKEMDVKLSGGNHNTKCDSYISDDLKFGTETAKDICLKFKILYNIIEQKRRQKGKYVDDKDFAYLNYWLNSLSRNTTSSNSVTFKEFQMNMDRVEDIFTTVPLNGKLYEIKNDDFNNMILLNELQKEHGQIYSSMSTRMDEIDLPCIKYFQKFINTYEICITKCPDNDTSFCKALEHFKGEYEKIFLGEQGLSKNCIDREHLKLPTYNNLLVADKKNTIVGSVLGPSFTPFGQWMHGKMGTGKGMLDNLYEENDQSLLNTSDNENMNLGEKSYRVSYDSIGNL